MEKWEILNSKNTRVEVTLSEGHKVTFMPKLHCEINPIDCVWCLPSIVLGWTVTIYYVMYECLNIYRCLLIHEVCSMSLTDGLSVLLVRLFLLFHLPNNVFTINECLKSTHYIITIQNSDDTLLLNVQYINYNDTGSYTCPVLQA